MSLDQASPERQRRESPASKRRANLHFGAGGQEGDLILRHVDAPRSFDWQAWADVADQTILFAVRVYLWILAYIAVLAAILIIRHGWPINAFTAPFVGVTVLIGFMGFVLVFGCGSHASWEHDRWRPRRLEVFPDRVLVTLRDFAPMEFLNRKITVAWGVRGNDRFAWGVGKERALILQYWGWKRLPLRREFGWKFAITGTDEQLGEAYRRLVEVGIRPRKWSVVEILAAVFLASAVAFSVYCVW